MSLSEYTPKTITLEKFHELLAQSYAVCVNDTLYFVGYDASTGAPQRFVEYDASTGAPYIANNDGEDYVDLSSVDGTIEAHPNKVFFYVGGEPIEMVFLQIMKPA